MSEDSLAKYRKKTKFAFEIRFNPVLDALDNKGKIIEFIHPKFKTKLPHWKVSGFDIQIANELNNPSKLLMVNHKSASLIYEDPGSLQEFIDDGNRVIECLFGLFNSKLANNVLRVGVRNQSIFTFNKLKSFEDILRKTKELFISSSSPITLTLTDLQFIFNHANGHILIGPIKKDEPWVKENFFLPDIKVPQTGLALDVDSFTLNPKVCDDNELKIVFKETLNLTLATQKEIILSMESGDFK